MITSEELRARSTIRPGHSAWTLSSGHYEGFFTFSDSARNSPIGAAFFEPGTSTNDNCWFSFMEADITKPI